MSNDLISRKLVYADDIYRYIKTEINPYGKPFEGSAYELGLKIMKHIENMSADYDVDKVVEWLEERKNYLLKEFVLAEKAREVKEKSLARINEIDEIIENVKAGGTDEN